jgi:molybdate transport system ATP-binding protein
VSDAVPLVALEGITARLREFRLLRDTTWRIMPGEQWVVLGPNGSGKSALVRTLAGDLPTAAGSRALRPGVRIELVSFEAQQSILLREIEKDQGRYFSGRLTEQLTPRELFHAVPVGAEAVGGPALAPAGDAADRAARIPALSRIFGFETLLDRPFRVLSAGEMRKALIIRALLRNPDLLILDEPFDGLDKPSRERMAREVDACAREGVQIVLVTHRQEEIPRFATHALMVRDLTVFRQGPVADVVTEGDLRALYRGGAAGLFAAPTGAPHAAPLAAPTGRPEAGARKSLPEDEAPPLVEFRRVTIGDPAEPLLRDFSWTVAPGEHWALTGSNGSGKTTLVNLISGDDQQAYAIELYLFGRRRGSGESRNDIRMRLGVVTPMLQLTYSRDTTVLDAVISGFFDSLGLYQRPRPEHVRAATQILDLFGITALAERFISRVSYGQRRLVLIARALVKQPELLLLDEPCQGLDPTNRKVVIDAVDQICRSGSSTVVYITHHRDEIPPAITRRLVLEHQQSRN